jgi:hypothetical protein
MGCALETSASTSTLAPIFGARQVSTIYTASNDYYVILECDPQVQADPTGLGKVFLKTNLNGQATSGGTIVPAPGSGINGSTAPTGPVIPLFAVTKLVPTVGALQVNHVFRRAWGSTSLRGVLGPLGRDDRARLRGSRLDTPRRRRQACQACRTWTRL